MRRRLHGWMHEKGRGLAPVWILRAGWLATGLGVGLGLVLWATQSGSALDYVGVAIACAGRPFVGWVVARGEGAGAG